MPTKWSSIFSSKENRRSLTLGVTGGNGFSIGVGGNDLRLLNSYGVIGTRYEVNATRTGKNVKVSTNGEEQTYSQSNSSIIGIEMNLGCMANDTSYERLSSMKFAKCMLKEGGNLTLFLIPFRKDGVNGVLNLVDNSFHASETSTPIGYIEG